MILSSNTQCVVVKFVRVVGYHVLAYCQRTYFQVTIYNCCYLINFLRSWFFKKILTTIFIVFIAGEYIPLESIDIFWRTLDVSWSKPLEDEDIQCDDDLHIFKENFNKQSNAGKMSFLRKLGCISNPSALLIKEPAVK